MGFVLLMVISFVILDKLDLGKLKRKETNLIHAVWMGFESDSI